MAEICRPSTTSATFFPISELLSFVFYQRLCTKPTSFQKSLSRFWSSLQYHHVELPEPEKLTRQLSIRRREDLVVVSLRREEVKMVIGNLGLSGGGGEGGCEVYGCDELIEVFERKGPSMEEVEEAFNVFDGNKDGFIDAGDLQRVLLGLGFREGGKIADCEKMIGSFDEDGDGKIDFQEFVKLMESSCW